MILISSTFTINPLASKLSFFLNKFDFIKDQRIEFTQYNQIFQELENQSSLTSQNMDGINVFVLKKDDFLRFQNNDISAKESLTIIKEQLNKFSKTVKSTAAKMASSSFIIVLCHDVESTFKKFRDNKLYLEDQKQITENFKDSLVGINNIYFISELDIDQFLSNRSFFDYYADKTGHIPFNFEYYSSLGYVLARKIFDIKNINNQLKAIILDCDNTLWKGICGEVGALNIEITPAYRYLQQFLKQQKEYGVLLCLCSKNNEKDIFDTFNSNKNTMPLSLEDIAAYRINWDPKSKNVGELITFLGFSEQNIIFIDDREDECFEVQKNYPNLMVIKLPNERYIEKLIDNFWAFDCIKKITDEDKNRTSIYQNIFILDSNLDSKNHDFLNQARNISDTIVDFIELEKMNPQSNLIQRVADLTKRTNQFNFAKKVYSESQIALLAQNSSYNFLICDVKDKRGNNYGLTGLVIYSICEKELNIDTFLLSCRIIGKNVEHYLLDRLVEVAKKHSLKSITFPFIQTDRNKPAEFFLNSIVGLAKTNSDNGANYLLSIDANTKIEYQTPVIRNLDSLKEKPNAQSSPNSCNAALIDIAQNYQHYIDSFQGIVISPDDPSLSIFLFELLNTLSGNKLSSIDQNIISAGIDSFEIAMFIAEIYRRYHVEIDFSTIEQLEYIKDYAKIISQKNTRYKNELQSTSSNVKIQPLSAAEKGFWLEKLKVQNDSLYNLFRVFELLGELNTSKLEAVFKSIIAKHESLRTSFVIQTKSSLPIRQVVEFEKIDFKIHYQVIDDTTEEISNHIQSLVNNPFNFEEAPLLRVYLLEKNPDHHYMLVVMHHIISDGWSFSKLISEINEFYNNDCNTTSPAPSYTGFIEWQKQLLYNPDSITSDLLRNEFANLPVLNLPYDFSNTNGVSRKGGRLYFALDQKITANLHSLSAQCKATIYETMLAIYMIFLAKVCNQNEVAFTSVVTTRPHKYFDMIGYMVNLVLLRGDLSINPSLIDFINKIKKYFNQVRKTANIPFLDHVEKYRDEITDIAALSRSVFVFENFPSFSLNLNNLTTKEIYCGNYLTLSLPDTAKFDLAIYFKEEKINKNNKILGAIEFNTDLFKSETISALIERFIQLVDNVTTSYDKPILSYSILTPKEINNLSLWTQGNVIPLQNPKTVLESFLAKTDQFPDKIAIVEENGSSISYKKLNELANKYSHYLKANNINKNDVVTVALERSIEMIALLIGIMKTGAIYLAIDPSYPIERRLYLSENAHAKILIEQPIDLSLIPKSEIIPKAQNILDTFYLVYTSGTTGKPKGIPTTHLAFYNLLNWFQRSCQITEKDNSLLAVSESFDAFGWQLWSYLVKGSTIHIISKLTLLDTDKFINYINNNGISICFIPTAYVEILINESQIAKIKTLKYLLTGGEKLNTSPSHQYPFRLINHYGVSECAVVSTFYEVSPINSDSTQNLTHKEPPIGKPIDNTEIYILDTNQQLIPIGIYGELCIGGVGVARGYLYDNNLSAEKFIKNPFSHHTGSFLYKTGDRARFLSDGNIEYLNRVDNQIEIDGFRIEPAEIEASILEYPQVKQAIVLLLNINNIKHLVAYIITTNNHSPEFFDTQKLTDFLRKKLPSKMIPNHIMVLDRIPVTKNGKVDKNELCNKFNLALGSFTNTCTKNTISDEILGIFSSLLHLPQEKIDIEKSFYSQGGDSLKTLHLLSAIEKKFEISIPIAAVFNGKGSIKQLANLVEQRKKGAVMNPAHYKIRLDPSSDVFKESLVVLQSGKKEKVPLFFIHPVGGTVFCYQKLIENLNKDQTCYGIQYPIYADKHGSHLPASIQELATNYLNPIRAAQPKGPYAIIGHSFGGMLSYEIAYQLSCAGEKVVMLAILDTWVVSILDKQRKQRLKRDIIEKYQEKYESLFAEDPMAETRFTHIQNIGFAYQPPIFNGAVDLFKAETQLAELFGITDDTNFWSKFVSVNIFNTKGDHDSMLEGNNAELLAKQLTSCILSKGKSFLME